MALLVRAAVLVPMSAARAPETLWGSNEAGMIAKRLLLEHHFGSTFHDYNGPTAWLAPGYPFLIAIVFFFFGVETRLAALVMMVLNAIFSSLTAVVMCKLGSQVLSRTTGVVAGWAWAVSPMVSVVTFLIWDSCLSGLIFSYLILLWASAGSPKTRMFTGPAWGLAGLLNPSLLAPLPFLALYSWWSEKSLKTCAVLLLSCSIVLAPWCIRNELVFHRFIPVRSNFWAEVYFGNIDFSPHPLRKSLEYQRLGEVAFVERLRHDVLVRIRNQPARFAAMTLKRALLFWVLPPLWMGLTIPLALGTFCGLGLSIRNAADRSLPLLLPLFTYPLIYFVGSVLPRYRYPVEPFMYILTAYSVCEGLRILRESGIRAADASFRPSSSP